MADPAANIPDPAPTREAPVDARRSLIEVLGVDPNALPGPARAAIEALVDEVIALRQDRAALRLQLDSAELLADRDTLCPVFNRRAFERELAREIALSERYGTPLSLIFIDLDRFKLINDRFGHATGDKVIQLVGQTLLDNLRQTDIIGRMGGDEFAIVLPHAELADCRAKSANLETQIDGLTVRDGGDASIEPVQLGASCGAVEWTRGLNAAAFIAIADETMFRAKARRKRAR